MRYLRPDWQFGLDWNEFGWLRRSPSVCVHRQGISHPYSVGIKKKFPRAGPASNANRSLVISFGSRKTDDMFLFVFAKFWRVRLPLFLLFFLL
jgi:hypothetical protein